MEVGPEGSFYMLEYGSVYGIDNVDARLVRIDYNGGNRIPTARITVSDTIGLAPFSVNFSAKESSDFDDDVLKYEWKIEGEKFKTREVNYTFSKNGVYKVVLYVVDPSGASDTETIEVKVGNTKPAVTITTTDNSTFFFDGKPFTYKVEIQDKEDKEIDPDGIMIGVKYLEKENIQVGHQVASFDAGKVLMEASDCKTCHQLNGKSVGPSLTEISKRYKEDNAAPERLITKVIQGGGGVWGEAAMNAHPQMTREEVAKIVKYILSVTKAKEKSLPQTGSVSFKEHKTKDATGRYVIHAAYTDQGGEAVPLTGSTSLTLRPTRVEAEEAEVLHNVNNNGKRLGSIHHQSYFVLKNIDLKDIKQIAYRYSSLNRDARIEVHVNAVNGPLISTANYKTTGDWKKFELLQAPITDPGGKNDLYFVILKEQRPNDHLMDVDWIEFKR